MSLPPPSDPRDPIIKNIISKVSKSSCNEELLRSLEIKQLHVLSYNLSTPLEVPIIQAIFFSGIAGDIAPKEVIKSRLLAYLAPFDTIQFKTGRTEADKKFLSDEYDKTFRQLEMIDTYSTMFVVGGLSTIGAPPITGVITCICVIARCATFIKGRYTKNRELSYICSACFGFVTMLMTNVKEMLMFYSIADQQIITQLAIRASPVWTVVQENLYKFLFFLIETIDFSSSNLGAKQYLFWNGLLSQVDLTRDPTSTKVFKYSRSYCTATENPNKTNQICDNYNDMVMRVLEDKLLAVIAKKDRTYFDDVPESVILPRDIAQESTFKYYLKQLRYSQNHSSQQVFEPESRLKQSNSSHISLSGLLASPRLGGGKRFLTKKNQKKHNRLTKKKHYGGGIIKGGGRLGDFYRRMKNINVTSAFTNPVNQLYREMLREYVIMTGNVSLIMTEYTLHYNKYMLETTPQAYKGLRDAYMTTNAATIRIINEITAVRFDDVDDSASDAGSDAGSETPLL